ncbi:MAG TPA: PEP-CTERM sorting domain-containing protein [Tepidisphaeraceae bacterium]|nr:PEP-CTERM sorting domain-containing protein [Tepidisphaeraceae bacterium]
MLSSRINSRTNQNTRLAVAAAAGLAIAGLAHAQPVVDGTLDEGLYTRFATQTVNTGFGDNQSELDAGYYRIEGGKLYLMLTGNVESNFNKLTVWFDTRAGGQNVLRNDNPNVDFNNLNRRYSGMTFDSAFSPDYHFHFSRNVESSFLNFSELNTTGGGLGGYLGQVDTPNPGQQGAGVVGGNDGLPTIEFGYADFNIDGVSGDAPNAANQAAAEAVTSGTELVFDLPSIGATGDFKIMVAINGSSHDYWSNQFLPGFAAPQGNLGGDALGTFITKPDPDGGPDPIGHVGLIDFNNIAGDQFLTLNYTAPSFEWDNAAGGNWTGATNWTADTVPNAIDAIATLGSVAGNAPRTVTLDAPIRLQKLTFDSPGAYTVAGSNALTIAGNPASPAVAVVSGEHTISAPLTLGATTNFNVAGTARLSITGAFSPSNQSIVKTGDGELAVPVIRDARTVTVDGGSLRVDPNGGANSVSIVTFIGTGAGVLDLTNNGLIYEYPVSDPQTSPIAYVKGLIASSRGTGDWSGPGIGSSFANSNPGVFGVGYAEASDVASLGTFMGNTVDATAVVVRYTRLGDADLSGVVSLDDFTRLAGAFGTGTEWSQGDFNYDGAVDLNDFTALAANFGLSAADLGRGSAVPEPASLGLSGAGALALLRRRRA